MNTNPDEAKLALWLDDELHGEELAEVEAWAGTQAEHLAAREEIRQWRKLIASAVPAVEEPPYAELFSGRVARAIREVSPVPEIETKPRFSWQSFVMPLAACAGMVLAFWLGAKTQDSPTVPKAIVAGAPKAISVEPVLYTPDREVKAEWFSSTEASATVIVLDGVDAIPDETDFSTTVLLEEGKEINSTAERETEDLDGLGL